MEQHSQTSELPKEYLGFLMALNDAWEEKCQKCLPLTFHGEIECEKCPYNPMILED